MFLHLLHDPLLISGIGLLLSLFTLSCVLFWLELKKLREAAEWAPEALPSALRAPEPPEPDDPAQQALIDTFVASRVDEYKGRIVVSRQIDTLVSESFEHAVSGSFATWLGGAFTGIALVLTFILIAKVLFADVGPAIESSSGEGSDATARLASAVGTMGGKFLISCTGIMVALFHQLVQRAVSGRTGRLAAAAARQMAGQFISMEAWHMGTALQTDETRRAEAEAARKQQELVTQRMLDAMQGVRAQLAEGLRWQGEASNRLAALIETRLDAVRVEFGKLDTLRQTVEQTSMASTQALGQAFTQSAQAQLQAQTQGAAAIQSAVTEASKALRVEMGEAARAGAEPVRDAVYALRDELRNQGQGQLEKLITDLRSAVSGGMSDETRRMGDQLRGFGDMIPQMSSQLSDVAGSLAKVVADLQGHQQRSSAATETLARTTEESARRAGEDIARGGSEALGTFMSQMDGRIQAMVTALDKAMQSQTQRQQAVQGTADEAAQSLVRAATQLADTGRGVQQVVTELKAVFDRASDTARLFSNAAQAAQGANDGLRQTAEDIARMQREAQKLVEQTATELARHIDVLHATQQAWDPMLRSFADTVGRTSDALSDSWGRHADAVQKVIQSHGSEFVDSVEQLSGSIDRLGKNMEKRA